MCSPRIHVFVQIYLEINPTSMGNSRWRTTVKERTSQLQLKKMYYIIWKFSPSPILKWNSAPVISIESIFKKCMENWRPYTSVSDTPKMKVNTYNFKVRNIFINDELHNTVGSHSLSIISSCLQSSQIKSHKAFFLTPMGILWDSILTNLTIRI